MQGKVTHGVVNPRAALQALQTQKPGEEKKEKTPVNKRLEARKQKFKERKAQRPTADAALPLPVAYHLDRTRNKLPELPEGRVKINSLPPAGYDDPVPTSTANFSSYFTELTKANNDTGIAGSKPLQIVDPTMGNTSVGGFSANLLSHNLNFMAPVLSLAGRGGLNLALALSYNSLVWTKNPGTNTLFYNADRGFPGPGWRIGFGAIQGLNNSGNIGPYYNAVTGKNSFLYLQPDGTRRDLAYNSTTQKYESYDSSYLEFDATTKVLRTTNGTRITFGVSSTASGDYQFLPTEIKDRNGNFLTVVYKTLSNNDTVIDYILDTLGRRIDFYYQSNRLTEIRQDRNGTIFKYLVLDYTPVTLASFHTAPSDVSATTVYVPARLTYPNGVNLRFTYNNYGVVTQVEKWVPTITGQGNERKVATTGFTYPFPYDDPPYFTLRNENSENWLTGTWQCCNGVNYWYSYGTNTATVTEPPTIPNVNAVTHTITNVGLVQTAVIQGPAYNEYGNPYTATFKTIRNEYAKDTGLSYNANLRPIESKITDQAYQSRKVGLSYIQQDGIWLVQHKDDYEANGTTVYRRTSFTYTSYPTQRILGLPLTATIYAGPGTTYMAKTENVYDETTSYTDSNSQSVNYFVNAGTTVQHDDTNYGSGFTARGNLTTVKQYATDGTTTRITGRTSYDTNGSIVYLADAAGNRQTIDLTDNFLNKPASVGATRTLPYTTANPIGTRAGVQYDYYTGLPLKSFMLLPNSSTEEQVTTLTYDFADRPLRTTAPTGAYTEIGYWDNLLRQTTTVKRDVVNSVDQFVTSFQDTDGAGRVIRKGGDHPNGGSGKFSGQKFKYDALGRGSEVSQVLAVDSSFAIDTTEPGQTTSTTWQWTLAEFDGLGRTTAVEKPDNTYLFTDYSVCGCAGGLVTTNYDERSNQKIAESDFLGRLKYAREYEPYYSYDEYGQLYIESYTLVAQAEYVYDVLDRLVTINHTAAGTGTAQVRSFSYDTWGRPLSETTPEAGTVSYTYTANDQVATTTNANNKTATVQYNTRNLVTNISYNDSGATPGVSYGYDDYGARTAMTDGEGTMGYTYNSYRQLQSETRTFTGLPNNNYTFNYSYTLAGQLKQANYVAPSFNKNINYAYKATGALESLGTNLIGSDAANTTNVLGCLSYRAFGSARQVVYGNDRQQELSYNVATMQLSGRTTTRGNGTNKIEDYLYYYHENGLISSIYDLLDANYNRGYHYNGRNQLKKMEYRVGYWEYWKYTQYGYDA